MSHLTADSSDKNNQFDDDDYENDDFVSFQLESKQINLNYSNLTKYSKIIRETYLFSDAFNRLPQEIQQIQSENQLSTESVIYFFQFSRQNYNVKENITLTYKQCDELLKLSECLQVRKLIKEIKDYIKKRNDDVDFIIQMIKYEIENDKETGTREFKINLELEKMLTSKINVCLTNEKFSELPISNIFRIVKLSSSEEIDNDKLLDFIKKSLKEFCVLFQFIKIDKLSEKGFSEICELYMNSNENDLVYFNYLKCDLKMIKVIINEKKNLQSQLEKCELTNKQIQTKLEETEQSNKQMQTKLEETEQSNKQMKIKLEETEQSNKQMQTKLEEKERLNKQQETSIEDFKSKFDQLQKQFKKLEEEKESLSKVNGQIKASVKKGLIITAQINLLIKGSSLDSTRSKYIVSKSDQNTLGIEAYEKGEPITSLQMNTKDFICKPGTYYIHCIVFNSEGNFVELLSNAVRTNGSSVSFCYEKNEPTTISLIEGQYKLEVWGAKGGDSTGTRYNSIQPSEGGLGGYSCGIVKLHKNENIFVYVGEQGHPANSIEGSTSKGGFPDGGGTKTGHCGNYTAVPGTGGGSTSIRVSEDTRYARVIVAGGGGGSGSRDFTDRGGFGGGLKGGNSNYLNRQGESGSGTETGSSPGAGGGSSGDPGGFGKGAEGKYMSGRDSGGGGGGGWYGGGSGGYGNDSHPGSGGGGSGWTFTEANFNTWKSGDPDNSSRFSLNSSYYLSEAITLSGNEEIPTTDGNGKERGHSGNGYAKITPL